jgi:hypothetical protein
MDRYAATQRAHTIVQLAATLTKVGSVKSWLRCDEKGTWEKEALQLLERVKDKAAAQHISEEQVNEEIAKYLVYLAVSATLQDAKKRSKR